MPNSNTFSIKPIKELIEKYATGKIVDPFANSNKLATVTNDLDTQYDTDYHMDALDFLKTFDDNSVDTVLYDPPYSPRQVSECYKNLGQTVNMQTTQASYWSKQKEQIGRIVKKDGIVITCSWNSGGIGKKYGFEIQEILLVSHGGWHNDTIVVVEKKIKQRITEYEVPSKAEFLVKNLGGVQMNLYHLWKKIIKQPIYILNHTKAVVFIDDKEYEITGIRYKNGKQLGLEADSHVWHNRDDYPEERKWIIVKDKNGTEHKYHQWIGHTYYEFTFDADGCDGYISDVDIASWRYDYSDTEK